MKFLNREGYEMYIRKGLVEKIKIFLGILSRIWFNRGLYNLKIVGIVGEVRFRLGF